LGARGGIPLREYKPAATSSGARANTEPLFAARSVADVGSPATVTAPAAAASGAATGPLREHPTNPRYFTDDGQRAVYLTGSHTWDNLQDMGESSPPVAFDFEAYLAFLARHEHNFIRLWRWELLAWDTAANDREAPRRLVTSPHPWARTGPGLAADGQPRFNLDQLDHAYFLRLRERVLAARDRGIYVAVMLFEGWGLQHLEGAWKSHPFHPDNHVNGLAPDADGDGRGIEVHTLQVPAVTRLQEAYVRRVIEAVNDLDNVLYEIANESGAYSTAWQEHFIRFIRETEQGRPKQHPVGMTFQYSRHPQHRGRNDTLFRGPANWVSPNPDAPGHDYRTNPPPATGAKVILADTDHLWGIGGDVAWVWKSFLRGLNPIFMDPYREAVLRGGREAHWETVRRAMGVTRRLSLQVDLATLTPQDPLASPGWCLAAPGREYLVFAPAGQEVSVDLTSAPGDWRIAWIHPVEGSEVHPDTPISGGTRRTLKSPFAGDTILHLKRRPGNATP
jgi:hypothetical protein